MLTMAIKGKPLKPKQELHPRRETNDKSKDNN
jgi:hypothetical protein